MELTPESVPKTSSKTLSQRFNFNDEVKSELTKQKHLVLGTFVLRLFVNVEPDDLLDSVGTASLKSFLLVSEFLILFPAISLLLTNLFGTVVNLLGANGCFCWKRGLIFLVRGRCLRLPYVLCSPRGVKYGWPSLLFTVLLYQLPPWVKVFDNGALGAICSVLSTGSL